MSSAPLLELNLGHHCNNRCVFCICGQLTERGLAEPNPVDGLRVELDRAVASGVRKVTFLGGEPTLQPGFEELMAYACTLGFEELTIFTNGARTGKRDFIEKIAALGPFTWRFSIQGGDELTHDKNTKRPGSFKRIVHGLTVLKELGHKTTVNTCVNAHNIDSLPLFPALLAEHGAVSFHADMVRPHSIGERSEDEVEALLPSYPVARQRFAQMMDGFARVGGGIEVNIGNLPFCVLPEHTKSIEHGGEFTWTISGDGMGALRDPLNKYEYQREEHVYLQSCSSCLLRTRCKGIPAAMYVALNHELVQPLTLADLRAIPEAQRDLRAVVGAYLPAPGPVEGGRYVLDALRPAERGVVVLPMETPSGGVELAFGPARAARSLAVSADFSISLLQTQASPADTVGALLAVVRVLNAAGVSPVLAQRDGAQLVESLMAPRELALALGELREAVRAMTRGAAALRPFVLGKRETLRDALGVAWPLVGPGGAAVLRMTLGGGGPSRVAVEIAGAGASDSMQTAMFLGAVERLVSAGRAGAVAGTPTLSR